MGGWQNTKDRYRNDPEYRQRERERILNCHKRNLSDPVYCRLIQTRRHISGVRDSLASCLARAARLEKRLFKLIEQRDELAALRNGRDRKCDR